MRNGTGPHKMRAMDTYEYLSDASRATKPFTVQSSQLFANMTWVEIIGANGLAAGDCLVDSVSPSTVRKAEQLMLDLCNAAFN